MDTSPKATAPAVAQATQRIQPVFSSPTAASAATTTATTTPAIRVAPPGGGLLTAVPAAMPTNAATPSTHTPTPTSTPRPGRRPVRTALSSTAIGTASTPTGCTTDSGASTSATACSSVPPPASASPTSQPGRRVAAISPGSDRTGCAPRASPATRRGRGHRPVLQHGRPGEADRAEHGQHDRRRGGGQRGAHPARSAQAGTGRGRLAGSWTSLTSVQRTRSS